MAYNKTVWINGTAPPINAENLNKIEQGIEDAHAVVPAVAGTTGQVLTKTASGTEWSDAGNPTDAQVAEAVTDWLDENITEIPATAPIVDASLTVQGAAADAKKTGDEINDLKSQINNFELLPYNVKQAMKSLFSKAIYKSDDTSDDYAIIQAWADTTQISSITAVFTQRSTVYPSTILNDLKADLVVTAVYSDEATITIPSGMYTLSGVLSEGTSAVTVAYGGKYTEFNVTVTADPFPYSTHQKVEWVGTTSTTNNVTGPYVTTGLTATEKAGMSGYEVLFSASAGISVNTAVGASIPLISWSSNTACHFDSVRTSSSSSIPAMGFARTDGANFGENVTASERNDYRIYWNNTSGVAECNSRTCTLDFVAGSASLSLKIGTGTWQNASGAFKFFGNVRIKKDGVLVREYCPCYNKTSNVIGFFELMSGTFCANEGAGAFEKGADI